MRSALKEITYSANGSHAGGKVALALTAQRVGIERHLKPLPATLVSVASGASSPAAATTDDGSCLFVGCTDPEGLDYDPTANYPGGCDYPEACPGDFTGDGEVDVNDLLDFFQLWGNVCE